MTAPGPRQSPDAFCKSQELPRAGAEGLQLVEFAAGLFLGLALTSGLCCVQETSFPALGLKQKLKWGGGKTKENILKENFHFAIAHLLQNKKTPNLGADRTRQRLRKMWLWLPWGWNRTVTECKRGFSCFLFCHNIFFSQLRSVARAVLQHFCTVRMVVKC